MNPEFLTIDIVLDIHKNQIEFYGGTPGIRDIKLLDSAISMPKSGYENNYLHNDIYEMAAAYLFHIVQNHPFVDGNKRVGLVTALTFLIYNDIKPKFNKDDLYNLVVATAEGKLNKKEIADFFRHNS